MLIFLRREKVLVLMKNLDLSAVTCQYEFPYIKDSIDFWCSNAPTDSDDIEN